MVVGTRIENPIVQALPPGPGTLTIIEKEYTGGAQGISSTTPVEITGTRLVFSISATQDVMFVGFATALPSADRVANIGFGINIDGVDYYGTISATPNLGDLVEAGVFVSKGLALGPGDHTVYLTAYRVSALYNPGSIASSATSPTRWEGIFGAGSDSPQTAEVALPFNFPGDLNTFEDAYIPFYFANVALNLTKIKGCLQVASVGADVHLDFYKVTLATGVIGALIGQLVIPAGSLTATLAITDTLLTTQGIAMKISQVGTNPTFGTTATAVVYGSP